MLPSLEKLVCWKHHDLGEDKENMTVRANCSRLNIQLVQVDGGDSEGRRKTEEGDAGIPLGKTNHHWVPEDWRCCVEDISGRK